MASRALVNIKFLADLKQFSSQMQNANRSIQKMGRKLQSVGTTLSIGVTAPLTAFGVASLKNWDKQVKAIAQVEAGLRSTGNAVGYTSKQLQKMASDLQKTTLFGDEDILKDVTAQLLTFTNISNKQFARTQQAALDLATRLDGDLKSASIQLGKALNDPVANLSALSRSGIQFSEDQKAMINSLVKTNKLAEAQTIILDELEKQYGGSAAAAAKAGMGPFKQLQNIISDISEEIGGIIAEFIIPFVAKIRELVIGFQSLSPRVKKFIVILGGIAAAIGPLLALAGTVLPAIAAGFAALSGPIALVVGGLVAIGTVIYKNWGPIKNELITIANYFIDLYNESTLFRIAVESVVATFKTMWAISSFVLRGIFSLVMGVGSAVKSNFKLIARVIKAVLTDPLNAADKINEAVLKYGQEGISNFKKLASNLSSDWQKLVADVEKNTKDSFNRIQSKAKIDLIVKTKFVVNDAPVITPATIGGGGSRRKKASASGVKATSGIGLGFATEIEGEAQRFNEAVTGMEEKMQGFSELNDMFTQSVASGFSNMANSLTDSLALADTGLQGFVKSLIKSVIQMASAYLAQSKSAAIAAGSTSAAASGPGAVFTLPAFIATALSSVIAAFATLPKFETGGVVGGSSFVGDKILARVNSGELILNRKQQNNLLGMLKPASSGPVELSLNLESEVRGDHIALVLKRNEKRTVRIR